MPANRSLAYQAPIKPRAVPWREELRFTLIGAGVGMLVAASVLPICFTYRGGLWSLPYLLPITYQLVRDFLPPFPVLLLFFWVIGGFCEWLCWGILIDVVRTFARARRWRSGSA